MKNLLFALALLFLACEKETGYHDIPPIDIDESLYPYEESGQYGNRLALFGGSVANLSAPCQEYWSEKLQLTVVNFALGGAGFTTRNNLIPAQVERALSGGWGKFDIYLFWCSTNDLNGSVGSASDSADFDLTDESVRLTQCRGINWCINRILENHPQAKIILFTSLPQFGEYGYTTTASKNHTYLFQLVDGQIACCKRWEIPYLEQFYTSPFNPSNYKAYYKDLTHPNESGYQLLMQKQARFIAEAY